MKRIWRSLSLVCAVWLASCASLPQSDPLTVTVAGIEPLPGEGLELRLAVTVRVQNPNDVAVEYTGAALTLELNGRNLASGVSDAMGTVPRYGETTFTIPVTISAFNMMRQVFGFIEADASGEVAYRVRGKLEGGWFGTRRFTSEGTMQLPSPPPGAAPG